MDSGKRLFTAVVVILLMSVTKAGAQENWVQDFSGTMQINGIINMQSSPAHLFVLSDTEGLAVFRTYPDSLQWLYRSTGMQQRGDLLETDIRFAYIYGNSRRLTVVEPTSVLGIYSSTVLPARPLAVQRIGNYVYIALQGTGLGRLSLETPETLDSEPEILHRSVTGNSTVTDLLTARDNTLYVLLDDFRLEVFQQSESNDALQHRQTVELSQPVNKLFMSDDELFGVTSNGEIYSMDGNFSLQEIADVEESVDRLELWDGMPVVRTETGILWAGSEWGQLQPWKKNSSAGNYFALVKGRLWVAEFNQLFPVQRLPENTTGPSGPADNLTLKGVENIVIPYPRPLLLPLVLDRGQTEESINFTYRSDFQNAGIRGHSFYWQPTSSQIGRHEVLVVATTGSGQVDSTRFTVDVRPFNTPPRFTPLPQLTIPVGEEFTFEINALDPDGMDQELIRYIGVDMPQGVHLNERTGDMTWTPNIRQVGTYDFQVIATDQYGAAAQQRVSVRVVETDRNAEAQID